MLADHGMNRIEAYPCLISDAMPLSCQVNEIKKKFNTEFEALSKLKRSEADKIMDLNAKIEETVRSITGQA